MSDDYSHEAVDAQMAQMAQAFVGLAGTAQGAMLGLYDHYEYLLADFGELNDRAKDRWRVVAIRPFRIAKGAPVTFLMERQVIVSDVDTEGLRPIDYSGFMPDGSALCPSSRAAIRWKRPRNGHARSSRRPRNGPRYRPARRGPVPRQLREPEPEDLVATES